MASSTSTTLTKQGPTTVAKPINYSKWEKLLEDDDKPYAQVSSTHQESMKLISEWIRETSPKIKSSELRRLIDFITVQHRGINPTNVKRAAEICAFLEKAGHNEQPDLEKLLALTKAAKKATEHEEEVERQKGTRVLNVAMGALNTLYAVHEVGNPRWLFDMLHAEPDGEVMKKYKEFGYAAEVIHRPEKNPYRRELPTDMGSWCRKLWKAVALQMIICVVVGIPMAIMFYFFGPDMATLEKNMMGMVGQGEGEGGDTPQWGQAPFRPLEEYEAWDGQHSEL